MPLIAFLCFLGYRAYGSSSLDRVSFFRAHSAMSIMSVCALALVSYMLLRVSNRHFLCLSCTEFPLHITYLPIFVSILSLRSALLLFFLPTIFLRGGSDDVLASRSSSKVSFTSRVYVKLISNAMASLCFKLRQRYRENFSITGKYYFVRAAVYEIVEIFIQSAAVLDNLSHTPVYLVYFKATVFVVNGFIGCIVLYFRRRAMVIILDSICDAFFGAVAMAQFALTGYSNIINALAMIYPFYSIYSMLSEVSALEIRSRGKDRGALILPDGKERRVGKKENIIVWFACLLHIAGGVLGLFSILQAILQDSACSRIYGACIWKNVEPKYYFSSGSLFHASCNASVVDVLNLAGCEEESLDDKLLDFENLEVVVFGDRIKEFPRSLLGLKMIKEMSMPSLKLPMVLNLSNSNLDTIPDYLQSALLDNAANPTVEILDFSGNRMTSATLSRFFSAQRNAKWKTKVRRVHLNSNQLHFAPLALVAWDSLLEIDLRSNKLQGVSKYESDWVLSSKKKRRLLVEDNPLKFVVFPGAGMNRDQIQSILGKEFKDAPASVDTLEISGNEIKGPIPLGIIKMTKLVRLGINDNNFNGTLPSELGLLAHCESIWLSDNHFTGSIPSQLGLLTSLKSLRLRDNDFRGTIPSELALLSQLTDLKIASNPKLDLESLPNVLANLTKN